MGIFVKGPAARLDYAVDWSSTTTGGVSIAASDWTVDPVEPAGIAVTATIVAGTRTSATFNGGIAGHVYRIANRITLSDGRIDDRALSVRVEAR